MEAAAEDKIDYGELAVNRGYEFGELFGDPVFRIYKDDGRRLGVQLLGNGEIYDRALIVLAVDPTFSDLQNNERGITNENYLCYLERIHSMCEKASNQLSKEGFAAGDIFYDGESGCVVDAQHDCFVRRRTVDLEGDSALEQLLEGLKSFLD